MGKRKERKAREARAFAEKARKQKERAAQVDADLAAKRRESGGKVTHSYYTGTSGDDTNTRVFDPSAGTPVTKRSGAATSRDQYTNDPEYDAYRKEHNAMVRREGKGTLLPDYGKDIKVKK